MGNPTGLLQLAFPDYQNPPAVLFEFGAVPVVPFYRPGEFIEPILLSCRWGACAPAIRMSMPKAAVHEEGYASARKAQVGFTGQLIVVQAIPVTELVKG
jgi:hypothetical protein